ncbi:MAG: ferrous iron transport protein A [archaeon]
MGKRTTLDKLTARQKATVISVKNSSRIHKRMLEMGVTAGALIEVVKAAPLGDPIEVKVRGYMLSLRKNEANDVVVEIM